MIEPDPPRLDHLVDGLAALAHDARLGVFRLLVRAGTEGLAAGAIGTRLGIPPTALSFHLNRLRQAGLVQQRRAGQRRIYSADFAAMRVLVRYLSEECCADSNFDCGPECPPAPNADSSRSNPKRSVPEKKEL